MPERYLALDLGAESGRAVVGKFNGDRLALEEVHRFANRPVRLPSGLYWDILGLYAAVQDGITLALRDKPLVSLGVDAWGVDYGLLDESGALLGNPLHYRDGRTEGMLEAATEIVPAAEIFEQTGIQLMPINSLFQLLSQVRQGDARMGAATTFLTIPDLLHAWLSGERVCEFTNATTTQCLNPRTAMWAYSLLDRFGISKRIFPPVAQPGTELGPLRDGAPSAASAPRVVLPGSHDTASAVAGTPLSGPNAAYISSGTWSLVGTEVAEPIITPEAQRVNVTNEGGVGGTFCLLKNVMGLWLLQGVRRSLETRNVASSYAELTRLAGAAPPFRAILDPDAPEFLRAEDMPAAIRAFCRATGQPEPGDTAALVRTVLESLALRYRSVIEQLEGLTDRHVETIHVVGGGSRNELLCQMTADATGRSVLAGPDEASAIGNLLVQMQSRGRIQTIDEGRDLTRRSFEPRLYEPHPNDGWSEAHARFLNLMPRAPS